MAIVLLQLPYSHFDEKARWALDYKGIEHQRRNLMPGTHRRHLKKLTGLSQLPVLLYNGEVVPGSHNIVLRVERKFPETRRLVPDEAGLRSDALTLATSLDEILGPVVGSLVYGTLMLSSAYVRDLYLDDKPRAARLAYRALFPLTRRRIARLETQDRSTSEHHVATTMDRLQERLGGADYLVGNRFTIADMTAAALLAPVINPPHPDVQKPEPLPCEIAEMHQRMTRHPLASWVLEMYSRHRP